MLLKYHIKELKYRIIYLIISLLITYIIIFSFNNYILLMFSPNINTFMMYSNIIDGILLKWTVSLYLTLLLNFPYIIISLWSFIRPGLYKKEDISIKLLPIIWILPLFIYFFIISIYNYYFIEFIIEIELRDNGEGVMERFLPTLLEIVLLIKNLIIISVIITILFIMSIYLNLINIEKYKRYRLHFIFLFLLLLTFFLPPDILILGITTVVTIIAFEIILLMNIIIKNYIYNITT
jgi:sec-independent protein translocase protein TatC